MVASDIGHRSFNHIQRMFETAKEGIFGAGNDRREKEEKKARRQMISMCQPRVMRVIGTRSIEGGNELRSSHADVTMSLCTHSERPIVTSRASQRTNDDLQP